MKELSGSRSPQGYNETRKPDPSDDTVLFPFPVLESPEEDLAMLNSECREDEASKLLKGGGGGS